MRRMRERGRLEVHVGHMIWLVSKAIQPRVFSQKLTSTSIDPILAVETSQLLSATTMFEFLLRKMAD